MPFEIFATSNVGRVRNNNEDMFLVEHQTSRQDHYAATVDGRDFLLAAVADGMGGHAQGEIASKRVLEMLEKYRNEGRLPARPEDHRIFRSVLVDIHEQLIQEQAGGEAEGLQMGTTLVGVWFFPEGKLVRFHAGDSRLYRWRTGELTLLTSDHTIHNDLIRAGSDPGQVSRHLITSCIGGGIQQPTVDTEAVPSPVLDDDRYLLCSDGLTDMVPDEKITTLMAAENAEAIVHGLVDAALDAGGRDNVTTVVLRAIATAAD